MKVLAVVLCLASAGSVFGQRVTRSFGSVVFPGGTSATSPAITRSFGSVVFPGGMQTHPVYSGASVIGLFPTMGSPAQGHAGKGQNFRRTAAYGRGGYSAAPIVYAYPVFVGAYVGSPEAQELPPQQEEAPPEQHGAVPVMIEAGPNGEYTTTAPRRTSTIYQPEPEMAPEPDKPADPPHYLLAFKDHSIYSAVAYWADGDTLHYITAGNVHNQASVALIDRELTERLNRELGIPFTLPPAK